MKMRPEHLAKLKAAITPLDTEERRADYVKQGFSSMRYRWDLLYAAQASNWICTMLYPYLNDTHIDTALRSIIPTIHQGDSQ